MGRLTAAILAALVLTVAPAVAQQAELDRVEALITAGEYAAARSAIQEWWAAVEGGRNVPAEVRARAHLLRARLAPDPRSAERDYLAVALGHPTTPYAPPALLALGQGLLASGDISRAVSYLKRLVDDYPASSLRPVGLLWLARARHLDGDVAGACTAARSALATADANLVGLLRREEQAACPLADARAQAEPRAQPADSTARAADRDLPAEDPQGRFAVQSGAFRQREGADALAGRLRSAGYEPRLVFVPGSQLLRVRIGRFASFADAEAVAARLRSAGFAAVVVHAVRQERKSRSP